MTRILGLAACALVLLTVTAVSAQQVVTGTVIRIDQPAGVVVLDNGHMYRATPQTVFLVNNSPTRLTTLQPGTPVAVQYGQPVFYRDGQYVVLGPSVPAGTVVAPTPYPSAGIYEVSGVVRWVGASDPGRQSITFDDGRQVWLDENTQVLAGGAPVMMSTLRPGTFVVVRSSKPFAARDKVYYTTAAPVAVVPPAAVIPAPTPTLASPYPGAVSGTVVRVDQPNMIVLSDGRMIPATSQTVVLMDSRPVPFATLRPGSHVVIYPDGQTGIISGDPSAMPRLTYPEMGLREKEAERNSP